MASPLPPTTPVPTDFTPLTGHCNCKALTYTLKAPPLIVHCCHCTWCQRESGSAFALNAMIETYNCSLSSSSALQPILTPTPSPSGGGQLLARCPTCGITIYTHYSGNKTLVFVKVGTLDDESRARVRPDVQIFTSTKLGWVDLSGEVERGVKCFEGYYDKKETWRGESLERLGVLKAWVEAEGDKASG